MPDPLIPVHNLFEAAAPLASCRGFRLFSQQYMASELPPVRVMQYALGLTLRGTATETIGLQAYALQPYTLVCTFPGQIISYADSSADLSFVYCVFDADFPTSPYLNQQVLERFGFFQVTGQPVFSLTTATGQQAQGLLEKIQAECIAQAADYELLVRLYLLELLVLVNREYPAGPDQPAGHSRGAQLSRRFKELVSQHFLHLKQVQEYADLLCITPRHLAQVVREDTGRPPGYWIRAMEILEAKCQLRYSSQPVATIAQQLGYADPAYFGKVFRHAAGCSPQAYRRG